MLGKGAERLENGRSNRDYPNYSIVETGLDTENSPGDLKRLAVTENPKSISESSFEKLVISLIIIIMTIEQEKQKTKTGRKTTLWTLQATNKRQKSLDMAMKRKPRERN